jgi:hypothetical protein
VTSPTEAVEVDHPTFNGLWVLIGDRVTVSSSRGSDKAATVHGLRVNDGIVQVYVAYDRKPPAQSRFDWVTLRQGSGIGNWSWISAHESAG